MKGSLPGILLRVGAARFGQAGRLVIFRILVRSYSFLSNRLDLSIIHKPSTGMVCSTTQTYCLCLSAGPTLSSTSIMIFKLFPSMSWVTQISKSFQLLAAWGFYMVSIMVEPKGSVSCLEPDLKLLTDLRVGAEACQDQPQGPRLVPASINMRELFQMRGA